MRRTEREQTDWWMDDDKKIPLIAAGSPPEAAAMTRRGSAETRPVDGGSHPEDAIIIDWILNCSVNINNNNNLYHKRVQTSMIKGTKLAAV